VRRAEPPTPPGTAPRDEIRRIEAAAERVRSLRPRLPADLADDLERAAATAQRQGALLAAEIAELTAMVADLDPVKAAAELKEAKRRLALAGPGEREALGLRVESSRQRYVAVHTAWNALEDALRELGELANRAEKAAAGAVALAADRSASRDSGGELAQVTDRIEALRRARAELGRLDEPKLG
jgi:hypothetical protein